MFLFGAVDPIHAVRDLSVASAGRALEIIDVESKNTLITVTSFLFFPQRAWAGWICLHKVLVLYCGLVLLSSGCAVPSHILFFGHRIRALKFRPIRYSGIHLPQRINRGFGYLCNSVDLDLNDLSQGE